jgi:hypothetical protein
MKCIFLDSRSGNWVRGYFHGFFQQGSTSSGFITYALVHSLEDIEADVVELYQPKKQLKFTNFADS